MPTKIDGLLSILQEGCHESAHESAHGKSDSALENVHETVGRGSLGSVFSALRPSRVNFFLAHPNPGKRSTENFTKISRQNSRHLWWRKTEKSFTSALLQGSCSEFSSVLFLTQQIPCGVASRGLCDDEALKQ